MHAQIYMNSTAAVEKTPRKKNNKLRVFKIIFKSVVTGQLLMCY